VALGRKWGSNGARARRTEQIAGTGDRDTRRSDHTSFWEQGFSAVMLTDTANFRNPHYHRPSDTIDTLNLDFMVSVADAVTAAVIDLAGIADT